MAISLQADSTLPQGYILVDGQRAATISTTGLSATLAANTVTTNALVSGSVTTEKIAPGAVITADLADGAVTAAKMSGGQLGSAPVYGCRAWVIFDGSRNVNGNIAYDTTNRLIIASGNVPSVMRNSGGDYTITFTTPMPTTNYAVVGACEAFSGNSVINASFNTISLSSVRVVTGAGYRAGIAFGVAQDVVTSISIFG